MIGKIGALIAAVFVGFLLLVLGILLGLQGLKLVESLSPLNWFEEEEPRTESGDVVVEGVRGLDQLSTVQVTSSVPITRESGFIDNVPEFLRGERVLLIAVGDVRAGIDLAEVGEDDVRVEDERVTLDLPEAEILSSGLDEERTQVYDRDQGLLDFNPDEDLETEARRQAVREIEDTARENGVLEDANDRAESGVRSFVQSLGFEEVEFK